jgi:hypothetical protein
MVSLAPKVLHCDCFVYGRLLLFAGGLLTDMPYQTSF